MPITKAKIKSMVETRSKKGKDQSPNWAGSENWDTNQFLRHFTDSMAWYRLESSGRELKPQVINWMSSNGYGKDDIKIFKDTKDSRCSLTTGAVAACLNKGMPAKREDFNHGKDTSEWLRSEIANIIEAGKNDVTVEDEAGKEKTPSAPIISIQDRLREAAGRMVEDLEDALENFRQDPESFDPKAFKVLNLLKGKQAKAAHARIIRGFYERELDELTELASGNADEQLREGYSHLARKNVKKLIEFYQEIDSACEMLAQEQKVNRKPKAKKAKPADKIVAKLKYAKSNEPLKLVSVNPVDIVGAKELWVFNTKTRKLGKYVAEDFQELSVKGTSIIGFNLNTSVQKTLRKPEEQLKEFKNAGKVQLRKFLEDIKAVDIKLNGRINEDTILLKIQ